MKNPTGSLRHVILLAAVLFAACFCVAPVASATTDLENTYSLEEDNAKAPFLTVTNAAVLVKGNPYTITGVADGTDTVYAYVFGPGYFASGTSDIISDTSKVGTVIVNNNNEFTITLTETETLDAGQYFMVIQHPMYDKQFNIKPVGTKIMLYQDGEDVVLFDVSDRQSANAAQALCDALDSEALDDMYVKLTLIVASPSLTINPIPTEIIKGTQLTISGTTNVGEGVPVTVEMLSTQFAAVPKETVGPEAFLVSTTTTDEKGNWEVTFDTSGLNVDEYFITAMAGDFQEATAKINVVDGTRPPNVAPPVVTPVSGPGYSDITLNPSTQLFPGQTVTGTLVINLPAGSIGDTDTLSFASPLINAKWDIHVIGGYPGPSAVLTGTSKPNSPFKPSMFLIYYGDMQDITLLVRFIGEVPESVAGSSINVINIQCSSSAIGSYVSQPQAVYGLVDISTDIEQLKYDILSMENRLSAYSALGIDVSTAKAAVNAAKSEAEKTATENDVSTHITAANNLLIEANKDLAVEGLRVVYTNLDTIDTSSAFLTSIRWDAEADYLKEQLQSLRTLYDSLAHEYNSKGTIQDITVLDELVYASFTDFNFATNLPYAEISHDVIYSYIGEDVTFFGTSADTNKLYAYIAGTNYRFAALNKDSVSSHEIIVTNGNWEYTVSGSMFSKYDAGNYAVYISPVADATSIDDLGSYTEIKLCLLMPFVSVTDAKPVAVIDNVYTITGTALATSSINYYIFGTNYFDSGKAVVKDNKFSIQPSTTVSAGQYFVVFQHPMYDEIFNVWEYNTEVFTAPTVNGALDIQNKTLLFDISNRQYPNAAQALCQVIDNQTIDDIYTKFSFIVAAPSSIINPIPTEIIKGSKLTVSGTTNVGEGVIVTVKMCSTAFTAVPEETVGSGSFISLTTVSDEDGNWKVTFDTSGLNVDEYSITAIVGDLRSAVKINVLSPPTESGIIIVKLPSNNVVDLYKFNNNMPKLMVSVKGESGTLPKKDVSWSSSNPNVLSIDDDGRYTPHAVGTAVITATTDKGTASETITVIDTTPKPATVPIKEPTKEGDKTKIESNGAAPIQVSADKTQATLGTEGTDTAIMIVTFEGEATDDGAGSVTGKVQSVTAEYKPASAAPADGVGGTVDYQLTLDLTNVTTALPMINSSINSDVADVVIDEYPNLKLAAMITAETNADDINTHLAKTGDGICLTFIVPTAWVESMEKIMSFHVKNGVIIGMEEIDPDTEIQDLGNGYSKITMKRDSFSTHGLAGEEKPAVTPSKPQTPSSTTQQGSSTWLTETQTPTPTQTPTEVEQVPTDIPGTQPTETETQSPGFGAFAVLAGLGAVLVLRRT